MNNQPRPSGTSSAARAAALNLDLSSLCFTRFPHRDGDALWLKNATVALMYAIAGFAVAPLAELFGQVTPLWPAAGVALAALLVCGLQCWPGVWLGAFLVNLGYGSAAFGGIGGTGAVVAALCAAGATTQALIGSGLARRFLRTEVPLARDLDLLRFLLRVGPLACVVSPTVRTAALHVSLDSNAADVVASWVTGWAGDSLGVLLFTPLVLLAWPLVRARQFPDAMAIGVALSLLLTGALLAAGNVGFARLEAGRDRADAALRMEEVVDQGFLTLPAAIAPLRGVERFMAASRDVTRQQFAVFTAALTSRPEVLAVDWAPRVSRAERDAFEADVAREYSDAYRIFEFGGDDQPRVGGERNEYFPVRFSEPQATNVRMLGLDHGFEAPRRTAMAQALGARGLTVATVVRPLRTQRPAILVYLPVYRIGQGSAAAVSVAARDSLLGYVAGVYDIQQLLAPLTEQARERGVVVRVSDVTPGEPVRVFSDTFGDGTTAQQTREIDFGGRAWRLELADAPLAPGRHLMGGFQLYQALSVLAALLAAFAALGCARRNVVSEAQVAERTAELETELASRRAAESALSESERRYRQLVETSPFGVVVQSKRCFAYVNPKALEIFGAKSARELLARPTLDFIHPDSRAAVRERLDRPLADGDATTLEIKCLRLDGAVFRAEVTAVVRAFEGERSVQAIIQDVTERRGAKEQLDRLFSLSADLLCVVDADSRVRRINPAFTRALGWEEHELYELPFFDLVHPDDLPDTMLEVERTVNTGAISGYQNRVRARDGGWRWLEWNAVSQPDGLIVASATLLDERREASDAGSEARVACPGKKRRSALEALTARKSEMRAVLDNLAECVVIIDERGMVERANAALETLLGYKPAEVVGRNVSMLMPEPHRSRHDAYLARYLQSGDAAVIGNVCEVVAQHKQGYGVPLELTVREFVVGARRGFLGTLRDVRERKALVSELTRAWGDAEQASRAKSAFLATMSHELRTPMNGVLGMVDVLVTTPLSEGQMEVVNTIRESAGTLLGLIDNILDFSKIEVGKMVLDPAPVSLGDVVERVCNALLPVAVRSNVHLSVFVAPGIPARVLSDDLRLSQVLYNLVGNAIKFSSRDGATRGHVDVRASIVSEVPLKVALRVADDGIGMSSEAVGDLFMPFTQAEASTTRRFGGSGLGLAISKRLVELMGGEIAVESTTGEGSVFTVTLPFEVPEAQPPCSAADLSRLECIVLSSPEFDADDMRAYLEDAGAKVHIAADEAVALGLAAAIPKAVLIQHVGDASAPGEDAFAGLPALRRLWLMRGRRRRARLAPPGVVTLDDGALRRQALVRAVAVAAGRASPEVFIPGDKDERAERAVAPDVAEARAQGRLVLVAEDDEINRKVIQQQLALLGFAAEIAADGVQALEMWRKGNYGLLLTDLHMPEMDGYALAQAIRAEEGAGAKPRFRPLPIVALTANALRGEAERAAEAGMDEYLTKPIGLERLREALEKRLPARAASTARDNADDLRCAAPAASAVDVSVLEGLVGSDRATLRRFLREYLDGARRYASELRAAHKRGESRRAAAVAHKLKSSSRSIGALALGELCDAIEAAVRRGEDAALEACMARFDECMRAAENSVEVLLAEPACEE